TRADVYTLTTLCAVSSYWWKTLNNRHSIKLLLQEHFMHVCYPYSINPKHVTSLNIVDGSGVSMAELNNILYVCTEGSDKIQVFDVSATYHFSQIEHVKVPGIKISQDFVVCSRASCLYISDCDMYCIWRVTLSADNIVDKFITTDYQPRKMSVQSSRLLV